MELKKLTLGERIKKLRLAFQKPYHCFTMLSNGQIIVLFEDEKGQRMSYTGKTMVKAVQNAEDWLRTEKEKTERVEKMEKKAKEPEEKTEETPEVKKDEDKIKA